MTEQAQIPSTQVTPAKNSKLEQLHAQYAGLKAAADSATKALKDITDAIKLELTQAAPDQARIDLASPFGPPLHLAYIESWRIDSTRMKREAPELYVQFAKKSGAWQLKPTKSGES